MTYKIERRIYEAAPSLGDQDVMSLAAAARLLNVSFSSIHSYLATGTLTTIIREDAKRVAHGKPRRFVLRSEVRAPLRTRDTEPTTMGAE